MTLRALPLIAAAVNAFVGGWNALFWLQHGQLRNAMWGVALLGVAALMIFLWRRW